MKAYVNKTTGVVYDKDLRDDAEIDAANNRVGHVTFLSGLPEGEIVSYDPSEAESSANEFPEYDSTYQQVDKIWLWDKTLEAVVVNYSVSEWRTQAEAEDEAAAAALDVTPDSA